MSTVAVSRCWNLSGTRARLQVGRLQGVVDWTLPLSGLHDVVIDGVQVPRVGLLGVHLKLASTEELSLAESYVRGDDLVATYEQTAARLHRTQAYWRVVDGDLTAIDAGAIVVELQVSINTSLLDVAPSVVATSTIEGETLAVAGGVLVRPAGRAWSYFELVHPADRNSSTSGTAPASTIEHRLFGRPLEKGVILRSRIRGAVLARHTDREAAEALAASFAASEPPLTT